MNWRTLCFLLIAAMPLCASPVSFETFAVQHNGSLQVLLDLDRDPLLITNAGSVLAFDTVFYSLDSDIFSATLIVPGVNSTEGPFMDQCQGRCIETSAWTVPVVLQPTPGSLTVTLDGVTATYGFRYRSPVPEPSSFVLFGMAILTCGHVVRRRSGRV